jgi:hypothetical protein
MICRAIIGCSIASLWFLMSPVRAVEYRLQVTNIDRLIFSSYLDASGTPAGGQEVMPRLEARLDNMEFPTAAVLPGREVGLLEDPAYGGTVPERVSLLPATANQAWTTYVWQGTPGQRVTFVIRSDMAAWQEIWDIASNPNGVLRRLTFGGPGLFGGQTREVPAVSRDLLATFADRGTFVAWLQQHAKPVGTMYATVGRRHDVFTSGDRLYMLLTLPPEPHTFKIVVAWRDHDDRGTGGQIFDRMHWRP